MSWWSLWIGATGLAIAAGSGYALSQRFDGRGATGARWAVFAILGSAIALLMANLPFSPFILAHASVFALGYGTRAKAESEPVDRVIGVAATVAALTLSWFHRPQDAAFSAILTIGAAWVLAISWAIWDLIRRARARLMRPESRAPPEDGP